MVGLNMNLLLPSGESLLQIIIIPRLKSPPAIPEVGFLGDVEPF